MRRTLTSWTLALCGGALALGVACDSNPPSNNTVDMAAPQPDMTMAVLAPNVSSISVTKGSTAGGTVVTITGTNFKPGATVTFGGKMATGVTVSADGTTITATTPASLGTPGDVDVTVSNNNGTIAATVTKGFRYFLGTVSFMPPGNTATITGLGTGGPRSLATLDLTGQGSISLISANGGQNNISVLANTSVPPALTFAAPVNIALGQNGAISAAVGDMNADGTADVVVANQTSNTLSAVIRSGTMATPNTIATAVGSFSGPRFVALADFDGDKNQDIAVSNANNTVSIVRGSANGTTYTAVTGSPFNVGFDAYGIAVGDFDGDMRPDVVVGNVTAASNTIRVILNKAAGFAMQTPITITGASQPNAIAVADFDGDKKLDLAVANRGGNVAILKGDGAGGFALQGALLAVGTGPEVIFAADLNLDGFTDLVVPSFTSSNLHFITGKGDGTFNAPVMITLATGSQPNGVTVADFNRDGKPDIAVTRYATGGIDILLGTGM
ncbi:MAG: FG-GAP-like repeat-containing protein [Polyangia bacterium]